MRIVTFINSLDVGGAEVALLSLIGATRHEVDHLVVSLRGGGDLAGEFEKLGVPVLQPGSDLGQKFRFPFRAMRKLASFKPELFVSHMYHASAAATLAKRAIAPASPLIWTIHHSLSDVKHERLSTRLAIRAALSLSAAPRTIVYVSERSADQHAGAGFPPGKAMVIPNGLDLSRFRFDAEARTRLRQIWGFSEGDVLVGHVARLHPMKDHPTFILALQRAIAEEPRLGAVVCGAGTESLELPPDLRGRVRLLGLRKDIDAVISGCDIGCVTSAYGEALPNVLAEFSAAGRPCVTTDVGDAARMVGASGRVVPPRDAAALAAALVDLARLSEAEREALGESARIQALDRFDVGSVAARHVALWDEAVRDASR
jgi:glycosyltransferase involved in cell wall biosynthesis